MQKFPLYFKELIKTSSHELAAGAKEWIISFQDHIYHCRNGQPRFSLPDGDEQSNSPVDSRWSISQDKREIVSYEKDKLIDCNAANKGSSFNWLKIVNNNMATFNLQNQTKVWLCSSSSSSKFFVAIHLRRYVAQGLCIDLLRETRQSWGGLSPEIWFGFTAKQLCLPGVSLRPPSFIMSSPLLCLKGRLSRKWADLQIEADSYWTLNLVIVGRCSHPACRVENQVIQANVCGMCCRSCWSHSTPLLSLSVLLLWLFLYLVVHRIQGHLCALHVKKQSG